jgi:hypothetical protein
MESLRPLGALAARSTSAADVGSGGSLEDKDESRSAMGRPLSQGGGATPTAEEMAQEQRRLERLQQQQRMVEALPKMDDLLSTARAIVQLARAEPLPPHATTETPRAYRLHYDAYRAVVRQSPASIQQYLTASTFMKARGRGLT